MTEQKSIHREKPIPKKKLKAVEELSELAGTKKTIMIASIKNLPASQFQEITKKLRGKAIVKVPKKNIILRAIDAVNDEDIVKSEDTGKLLDSVYSRNKNLVIYSFDINLDDKLIIALKEKYHVDKSPTIVVNENNTLINPNNIQEIEKYLIS